MIPKIIEEAIRNYINTGKSDWKRIKPYAEVSCEYCARIHSRDSCPGCGAPKTKRKEVDKPLPFDMMLARNGTESAGPL